MSKPAIIFDFGGVLLDINYEATALAFQRLANRKLDFGQYKQAKYFDKLECGQLEEEEFFKFLRSDLGNPQISNNDIISAFNQMLGGLPGNKIDFLCEIRSKARIFLLSNTNSIHKRAFERSLNEAFSSRDIEFEELFEACYYSHLVGQRKPNKAIYQDILEKHHLDPLRSLFIDDNIDNVRAASELNIRGLHLEKDLLDPSIQSIINEFLTQK